MVRNRANSNVQCSACPVSSLCIPHNLSNIEKENLNAIITHLHCMNPGEHLYYQHQKAQYIFSVYSGSCKEYIVDEKGKEIINSFYFPGDLLALESLTLKKYTSSLVALEACQFCAIPVNLFFRLMNKTPALTQRFIYLISKRLQKNKIIPITTNAKCRVAAFLLDIYYRLYSGNTEKDYFCLPMSQLDISNLLGLAHETISRILHEFQHRDLIKITRKKICITNISELKTIAHVEDEDIS